MDLRQENVLVDYVSWERSACLPSATLRVLLSKGVTLIHWASFARSKIHNFWRSTPSMGRGQLGSRQIGTGSWVSVYSIQGVGRDLLGWIRESCSWKCLHRKESEILTKHTSTANVITKDKAMIEGFWWVHSVRLHHGPR